MTDGCKKWSVSGNCVYAGDDLGSLVAECSSRAVAEELVSIANGYFALRVKIAAAMNRSNGADVTGVTQERHDD